MRFARAGRRVTRCAAMDEQVCTLATGVLHALEPAPLTEPYLVGVSDAAAALIGLDLTQADPDRLRDQLAGNRRIAGTEPLASVYSGHQFGVYVRSSATAVRCCSARSRHPSTVAGRCSSRAPAGRPTRAWATAARCCARRSASSSAPRPWQRLGIPTTRALAVIGGEHAGAPRNGRDGGGRHATLRQVSCASVTSNISTGASRQSRCASWRTT